MKEDDDEDDGTRLQLTELYLAFMFGVEVAEYVARFKPEGFDAHNVLYELAAGELTLVRSPTEFRADFASFDAARDRSNESDSERELAEATRIASENVEQTHADSVRKEREFARKILGPFWTSSDE